MSEAVLKRQIKERLETLQVEDNSIVVLKGIPIAVVDPEHADQVDLEKAVSNKLSYFFGITTSNRRFLTYEEFLLMSDFVLSQYKSVYILVNNIYMSQYPLDMFYSEATKAGLLTHFMEVDDHSHDDDIVGNIQEFISLYLGLKEYNGFVIGAYCDNQLLENEKVVTISLFDEPITALSEATVTEDFVDLVEEADYIELVRTVFAAPDEVYVRTVNYTGDLTKLTSRLKILATYWSDWTDIYVVRPPKVAESVTVKPEFAGILQKYWGYSSFRDLLVYDMASLEDGKKEVVSVSQSKIISDLVQQVEQCESGGTDFRDVFVTAPTGAGKSVMFQIPAIYLAEKYNLLTIVISPLIGLMNDQVKNLEVKNYSFAKTINSDISPVVKQEIMEKVANGEYHILYISPETLLSRSDVEQLIGKRTIGMIVIDEAHIVTTWGKQFRPDYWYLGDHIKKLRRNQMEKQGRSFVVATFTATAIYHGIEDMYTETINSLHMLSPITYLGYVRRKDITIMVDRKQREKNSRTEYELDKFAYIEKLIQRAIITGKKTLIYFPTVALINRCYEYFISQQKAAQIAIYHGSLNKDKKAESYEQFLSGQKLVMLATKAFGMGIDINDIAIVAHFAPTGNVCDYVQEIGRAARRSDIIGEAVYQYDSRDFKHINRLHGLSMIQKYQLVEVVKKIYELFKSSLANGSRRLETRRRNAMLLDAENFSYIFQSPAGGEDDNSINKVKTALLIIQKDFENRYGFSPISVRPIPLFSVGYFEVAPETQAKLLRKYPNCLSELEPQLHICEINLEMIWKNNPECASSSFPQFKYLLYSKDPEFDFVSRYPMNSALCVSIEYAPDHYSAFERVWNTLKAFINKVILSQVYVSIDDMTQAISDGCDMTKYKARAICEVIIASMDAYRRNYSRGSSTIVKEMATNEGKTKYLFNVAVNSYLTWVGKIYRTIVKETREGKLYLINDGGTLLKETSTVLGILEALDVLSFNMIGGANSQLYIYINQTRSLEEILNRPGRYQNRLLDAVSIRHLISVKMLTYIYEGNFSSEEIWDLLEDYFLGVIPEKVKRDCRKENPNIIFDL
ncbi:MAG: DEAD/DEAH box helicase [Firmicutes bacterium]|nr:DEAD/DEAH box helicase [Bacillota bacterium]